MNIEDYLELLAGHRIKDKKLYEFEIDIRDVKLIKSLALQVSKNIGLSNRQHDLSKKKLLEYENQFLSKGLIDLKKDLNNLRIPLRSIDRSKTIKLVLKDHYDFFNWQKIIKIAIKFPYSKKMLKHINFIKQSQGKNEYDSKTKTHFVDFSEQNVLRIVGKFKDINFEIDDELLKFYDIINDFQVNKKDHLPGIYNYQFKNLHNNCKKYLLNNFGKPSAENLVFYYDKRKQFGLGHFDEKDLFENLDKCSPLTNYISKNGDKTLYVDRNLYNHHDISLAINFLKRFPLLIVLKNHSETTDLLEFVSNFKNFLKVEEMSVLFRLENNTEENIKFNNTVKLLGVNNPVTSNTKIIFLNNDRIPKPLLLSNYFPDTTILCESFRHKKHVSLYYEQSDLVIHYDNVPSSYLNFRIL